jgi:LmbE family N-acetylglucosaminyl deacetylase
MTTPAQVVGVFAHPDDEIFCAGGSMATWSASGSEVTVVCATQGEAGQIRDASTATRRTLGDVREAELRAACAHLGVARVTMLDYADGRLSEVDPSTLAARVRSLLVEVDPDVVVTFGEDGAYGHPDHIAIGDATAAAVADLRTTAWRTRTTPVQLLRSHFPTSRMLLAERLAAWLTSLDERFGGAPDYGRALLLFAEESTTMRFAGDDVRIAWYPGGTVIVEQGEPATSLLLILSGTVDVLEEDADGETHLMGTLHEGQFFGELGVAGQHPRTASVVAVGNVTCLALSMTERTKYEGRGSTALSATEAERAAGDDPVDEGVVHIDVTAQLDSKLAALTMHRSQYPIDLNAFPRSMLLEMYGIEHFRSV